MLAQDVMPGADKRTLSISKWTLKLCPASSTPPVPSVIVSRPVRAAGFLGRG